MNLLLDTHVFIWMYDFEQRLSKTARESLADSDNKLYLSTVSIWEVQIKFRSGKLKLAAPVEVILDEQIRVNDLGILNVERNMLSISPICHPITKTPLTAC